MKEVISIFVIATLFITVFAHIPIDKTRFRPRTTYKNITTVWYNEAAKEYIVYTENHVPYKMPKYRTVLIVDSTRNPQVCLVEPLGVPDTIIVPHTE